MMGEAGISSSENFRGGSLQARADGRECGHRAWDLLDPNCVEVSMPCFRALTFI